MVNSVDRNSFFSKAGLANAHQRIQIATKISYVTRSIGMQGCDFFFPQVAQHLTGRTYHQRIVRDYFSFGNQRVCTYQTVAPDYGVIKDGAVYADQAAVANDAAVQHHQMTDSDIVTYGKRRAGISVQHCAILNVAVFADADGFVVATYHRVEPDADIIFENDRADDAGIGRDEMLLSA